MLYLYSLRAAALSHGICCLYENKHYDCIHNLSRDFLEVYATLQSLIKGCTGSSDIHKTETEILYRDLMQDYAIYKSILASSSNSEKAKDYLKRFVLWLNRIDDQKYPKTLPQTEAKDIVEKWSKNIPNKNLTNQRPVKLTSKARAIKDTMEKNQSYKAQFNEENKDASYVYSLLCSHSHSNFSTIQDLELNEDHFVINKVSKNVGPCLFNIHWALRDIIQSLQNIAV